MKQSSEREKKLKALEARIAETRQRLPAHSVKPAIMMELLELEDEYEALLAEQERDASE